MWRLSSGIQLYEDNKKEKPAAEFSAAGF